MIERDLRVRVAADAERVAYAALQEDGARDVTTEICVAPTQIATGVLECRNGGVVAGQSYADAVAVASGLQVVNWYHAPGTVLPAGATLGLLQGELTRILRAERPLLNLLQRAVGIATATHAYVEAVRGTPARILHTRKTAPGLRLLDVSAVLAGGGQMHRLDLATTLMVKDNHWRALATSGKSLARVLEEARARGIGECHVEVESPDQVREACTAGADRLLIDNQAPDTVRAWAAQARGLRKSIAVEATGGIHLTNVRAYAEAGVDYISIGSLTHSVQAADVAMGIARE